MVCGLDSVICWPKLWELTSKCILGWLTLPFFKQNKINKTSTGHKIYKWETGMFLNDHNFGHSASTAYSVCKKKDSLK